MPKISLGEFGSPNAFAVGRRNNGHIVISKTLTHLLTPDELAAVVVHELSHLRSRDAIPMVIGQGSATIAYYLLAIPFTLLDDPRQRGGVSTIAGTIAHLFVLTGVFAISRQREYIADADARHVLGTGETLASALEKITTFNQQHTLPDLPEVIESLCITSEWSFYGLTSTHPSVDKRIHRLRTTHPNHGWVTHFFYK